MEIEDSQMITNSAIRRFNKELNFFGKTLMPEALTTLVKAIAFEIFARVIFKTPVDTGRARGNWQISIGQPILSVLGLDSAQDNAFAGFGEEGQAAASVLQNLNPFDVVFISNNVPYILFLEDGTSDQAPFGMIAETFEEVIQIFPERGGPSASLN